MMPARKATMIGIGLVATLGASLALYGSGTTGGNSGPCAPAEAVTARLAPLARGEVAAFQVSEGPRPAPAFAFKGPDGAETTLAGMTGRTLLVNLWATWCAPCKAEMPALDRLQSAFDEKDFHVVAINVDTRNLDRPPLWLKENAINALAYYADHTGRVLPVLQKETGSLGLPTTFLVDPQGCMLGLMKGPADWGSEDAKRLIGAAVGAVVRGRRQQFFQAEATVPNSRQPTECCPGIRRSHLRRGQARVPSPRGRGLG